jgi:periplasmic divalent cation tolerance protein
MDGKRLAQVNSDGNPVLVYTTCPSKEVAKHIAGELVRQQLAACANILPAMEAVFIWQGEVQSEAEVAMLLKTRRGRADRVVSEIERLHPYDTPAILVIPVEGGSQPFIDWIAENTQ